MSSSELKIINGLVTVGQVVHIKILTTPIIHNPLPHSSIWFKTFLDIEIILNVPVFLRLHFNYPTPLLNCPVPCQKISLQ